MDVAVGEASGECKRGLGLDEEDAPDSAGKDKDGDFKLIVKQKQYNDALFLIAENFLDSLLDDSMAGGGTAVLRMTCPQRVVAGYTPRAVGVPTGWSLTASGFPHMDNYIKTVIDLSLDRIALVLDQYPQFKRLILLVQREGSRPARRRDL